MTVDVQEIQTLLSQLLERVSAGEEIVIARDGQPIARLLPPESNGTNGNADSTEQSSLKPRVLGLNRGEIWMADDFDAPLPDEFWLGENEVLNPATVRAQQRVPGLDAGHARIADDFDAPLPPDIQCFFE